MVEKQKKKPSERLSDIKSALEFHDNDPYTTKLYSMNTAILILRRDMFDPDGKDPSNSWTQLQKLTEGMDEHIAINPRWDFAKIKGRDFRDKCNNLGIDRRIAVKSMVLLYLPIVNAMTAYCNSLRGFGNLLTKDEYAWSIPSDPDRKRHHSYRELLMQAFKVIFRMEIFPYDAGNKGAYLPSSWPVPSYDNIERLLDTDAMETFKAFCKEKSAWQTYPKGWRSDYHSAIHFHPVLNIDDKTNRVRSVSENTVFEQYYRYETDNPDCLNDYVLVPDNEDTGKNASAASSNVHTDKADGNAKQTPAPRAGTGNSDRLSTGEKETGSVSTVSIGTSRQSSKTPEANKDDPYGIWSDSESYGFDDYTMLGGRSGRHEVSQPAGRWEPTRWNGVDRHRFWINEKNMVLEYCFNMRDYDLLTFYADLMKIDAVNVRKQWNMVKKNDVNLALSDLDRIRKIFKNGFYMNWRKMTVPLLKTLKDNAKGEPLPVFYEDMQDSSGKLFINDCNRRMSALANDAKTPEPKEEYVKEYEDYLEHVCPELLRSKRLTWMKDTRHKYDGIKTDGTSATAFD